MVTATDDIDGFVRAYAAALVGHVRVERILLFGSRARGAVRPESDVDLLVVSPDLGRNVLRDIDVVRGCIPPHADQVDTLSCTPEETAAPEAGTVLATGLSEGIVVYRGESTA